MALAFGWQEPRRRNKRKRGETSHERRGKCCLSVAWPFDKALAVVASILGCQVSTYSVWHLVLLLTQKGDKNGGRRAGANPEGEEWGGA